MEEIEEYRHDLWNEVLELARDRDIYDQEAFFETACEILRDSEAITAYHPAYCRYLMGTNKALAIDGYDQDAFELDESIVVIVCDDKLTMNDQKRAADHTSCGVQKILQCNATVLCCRMERQLSSASRGE